MKREFRFRKSEEEKQQETARQEQSQQQGPREFNTVEEMLRHDSLLTPVPPSIGHKLNESIRAEPRPPRPWWRRLFGTSG
jgi:hypothetical protein